MKVKNVLFMVLMIVFAVLAYLFLDRGLNTKTKNSVAYQEKSDITYKVYLLDNDIYDTEYLDMDMQYITKLVDYIDVDFNYGSTFNKEVNGYYNYDVVTSLVGYSDNISDSIFKKEDKLLNQTKVLDKGDNKAVKINDKVKIDYEKYLNELKKYNDEYNMNLSGYLDVKILVTANLNFNGSSKIVKDKKEMSLMIPLSGETFKISVTNDNNSKDKYYNFSNREKLNYIFLLVGILSLAASITFIVLTIKNMIDESRGEINYRRELRRILNEYKDILVHVDSFYPQHTYNMIYVTSFAELMDAYRRVRNPISYKEVKKNAETLFLMIDEDSVWIYPLVVKDNKF